MTPLQRQVVQTPMGPLWLWSHFAFDAERPLVLAIRGSAPPKHHMETLRFPGADVVFVHLPGWHSPGLITNNIGLFIAAFDQAIQATFPDRRILALGVSTGSLVAAGLWSPQVFARLLIEPFFGTDGLWPLIDYLRPALATQNAFTQAWVWNVLGVSTAAIENRDYHSILRPGLPMRAIVGDVPLAPRRSLPAMPSLTSCDDRRFLESAGVMLTPAKGGHDVPKNDPKTVERVAAAMLKTESCSLSD